MTDTINSRFRLTRQRLGLSQREVGDVCGVTKTAVMRWEEDTKIPASALVALIPHGFDALYVLTDAMQESSLAREEQFLIEQYRDASVEARRIAATVLQASVMTQGMPGAHIVERLHATHQSTLSDIAHQIGVSRQAVHQVVHGTGSSLPIASYIAKIFGSTPSEVWPEQYGDAS